VFHGTAILTLTSLVVVSGVALTGRLAPKCLSFLVSISYVIDYPTLYFTCISLIYNQRTS